MDSEQLAELLLPIPSIGLQDEIIETHLIRSKAADLVRSAETILDNSLDKGVHEVAKRISSEAGNLLTSAEKRRDISTVLGI